MQLSNASGYGSIDQMGHGDHIEPSCCRCKGPSISELPCPAIPLLQWKETAAALLLAAARFSIG